MTMILGTVQNFSGLAAVRFFLGVFEAGLFPGLIYCTTFWYKRDERALRVSFFSAVATLGKPVVINRGIENTEKRCNQGVLLVAPSHSASDI